MKDIHILKNVVMNRISDEKLEEVIGGASVSGTIINAFTNVIKVLIDAGIGVGSAIRRVHRSEEHTSELQ